jgi:hypothetical protein
MEAEFNALQANRTWRLVDKPAGAHIISGKWVFKHKLHPDGRALQGLMGCAWLYSPLPHPSSGQHGNLMYPMLSAWQP